MRGARGAVREGRGKRWDEERVDRGESGWRWKRGVEERGGR